MSNKITSVSSIMLRLMLGWYMFFAGIEKVMNTEWSASGFLMHAKTFPAFYAWFGSEANAWWINPLNAWGIFLVGVALLLGVGIRFASILGATLMILYYFPHNVFPTVPHGFIVEEHIINAVAFIFIAFYLPAHKFGLADKLRKTFLGRIPVLGKMI